MTASFDHGRHWYFLAADGDPQQKLRAMFGEMAQGNVLTVEHEGVFQMIQAEGDLRCSFLLRGDEFIAGYPIAVDGYGWPLKIHDRVTWPDGIQANLIASCEGARVCLFDAQHFLHRDSYSEESERTFVVAGLAYKLFDTVFESPEQKEKLAETKAYFPVDDAEGGRVDEIKFMSHVEVVREVDFWGTPLLAFTLTLAEPEDFPMRLDIFAHPSACEKEFRPGDRISGFAWLFGAARAAGE